MREKVKAWIKRWWVTAFSAAGAVAAAYGAIFVSLVGEDARWIFIGTALLGASVAALLPAIETKRLNATIAQRDRDLDAANQSVASVREEALKEGRKNFIFVLEDTIKPLLRQLGPVIRAKQAPKREPLAAQLQQSATAALVRVVDPVNATMRANYFKMRDPSSTSGHLYAASSSGDKPRTKFYILDDQRPYSAAIKKMMSDDTCISSSDISVDAPPGFNHNQAHRYKSFISTAASDGIDNDGMMTIDSPSVGVLDSADETLVRLIGTIVALSEAARDGKTLPDDF